ncbi:MAG TPA: mechanosensitive ion channel domain-containing protein [Planctomycetota bacterium]|nr:mechanosensitive ion channel domain-containing protein [Planctomycetota bacterium]
MSLREILKSLPERAVPLLLVATAAAAAIVAHAVIFAALRRASKRSQNAADDSIARRARGPSRWLLVAIVVQGTLLRVAPTSELFAGIRHLVRLVIIASAAWLVAAVLRVVEDVVARRFRTDVRDNLQARTIQTQFRVLRRLAGVAIGIIAAGAMLMTFPGIRQLGTTLLASAGVVGLMIGMAARPLFANLIAGVQIAITQPIRLDDVVIVEGEWGKVEEIRSTYVVVAIWDDRRLIVPLSRFIEAPFQNWTRTRSDLLGTVFLHVDYTLPVDEARAELKRILDASPHWDRRVSSVQVTEAGKETVELRLLMSAGDSSAAWDLRCEVREKMIAWLQRKHPECLPRRRIEGAPVAG